MGPLLFNIVINDLYGVISHLICLLYADGVINSLFLQSDLDCIHELFAANFMKVIFSTAMVTSLARKLTYLITGMKTRLLRCYSSGGPQSLRCDDAQ